MSTDDASKTVFDSGHKTSDNNAHEHQSIPVGRQTPPCSCQSACAYIESVGRTIRETSPRRSRYSAEFESLLDYAEKEGLNLPESFIPARFEMAGQEHDVWPSPDSKRVYKATKPNEFGVAINCTTSVPASEYFRRMALTNQVFGDDIRFEGIALVQGKIRVVISQPIVAGRVTQPQEVIQVMGDMGFNELEINEVTAWYREEDNVLAFDAHTKNFLTTDSGPIPIDVNLHQPDAETRQALLAAIEEQRSGRCDPDALIIPTLKVVETVSVFTPI